MRPEQRTDRGAPIRGGALTLGLWQELNEAIVSLWLYERVTLHAYRAGVGGWPKAVCGWLEHRGLVSLTRRRGNALNVRCHSPAGCDMLTPRKRMPRDVSALVRGLALGALVIGGCIPASAPATSSGPTRGGTLTVALWQEPASISPFNQLIGVAAVIDFVALDPLARTDNDGNYQPVLATRVPTLQNGGARLAPDGRSMDITWELRSGLRWSDGEPVTSADIKFTWETVLRQKTAISRVGFDAITAIDLPDERTAVLHYPSIFAPYITTFASTGVSLSVLLPKHLLEHEADIAKSAYASLPVGAGPFRLTEWTPNVSITAERNPYYWKPGRPYLDRIVFKFVPSQEDAATLLKSGTVDGAWNLLEAQALDLARYPSVKTLVTPGQGIERIEFNFAQNRDMTDPQSAHPVLSDIAVRRALLLATPKQEIIDKLLYGKAVPGRSVISRGWAAVNDVAQEGYDPAKAKQLLDEAGWVPGPDGVRTRAGVRASLTITTTEGNDTRERIEAVLADSYRQIGVELTPRNAPIGKLVGWASGGLVTRGSYDLFMINTYLGLDPQAALAAVYRSSSIPSAANGGVGSNATRFRSAEVDRLIDQAGATLDPDTRKAAYGAIVRLLNDAVVSIWLYEREDINAYRIGVGGWAPPIFGFLTWNSDEWSLAPAAPQR